MLIHWDHAGVSLNAVWSFYLLVGAPSASAPGAVSRSWHRLSCPRSGPSPLSETRFPAPFRLIGSLLPLFQRAAPNRGRMSLEIVAVGARWNGIRACGLGYSDWKEQLRPAASVDLVFCYSSGLGRSIFAQPTRRYLLGQ